MSYFWFIFILSAGAALSLLLGLAKIDAWICGRSGVSWFAVPLPFLVAALCDSYVYLQLVVRHLV